jgi:hypothetical protein
MFLNGMYVEHVLTDLNDPRTKSPGEEVADVICLLKLPLILIAAPETLIEPAAVQ